MLISAAPSNADPFKATLNDRAHRVTLPIFTPASSGSITIIGKTGSNYTFLTSAHVIAKTAIGEVNSIDLFSQAGRELFAPAIIKKNFMDDGVDLAVGTFQYSGKSELIIMPLFALAPDAKWEDDPIQYNTELLPCNDKSIHPAKRCIQVRIALTENTCMYTRHGRGSCDKYPMIKYTKRISMGTYERFKGTFSGKNSFEKTGTIGDFVVAGYSLPSRSIVERIFRISNAVPLQLLSHNKEGYNLIYEATSTVQGMSGGPVLAARVCPRENEYKYAIYGGIIGVHGRSEEYGNTQSRSGISLAVPITSPKVIQYLTSNAKNLGIPIESTYVGAVKDLCS